MRDISTVLVVLVALSGPVQARTERVTYFENTDYALEVYKIYGRESGRTIMIIGGIQGDEPGGYLTADLYVDLGMERGNLIVIPRANFRTIMNNTRSINADMNRQFNKGKSERIYEEEVAEVLQTLMRESHLLLNLHDGSGYYSADWTDDQVNPRRWGQSIIIDEEQFETGDKKIIPLADLARKVAERVNREVQESRHLFHVKNTRTADADSAHPEQRLSATFFAVTQIGIPAFGIETSKSITPYSLRMRYQSMVVNEFLRAFDVVPENPPLKFDTPQLDFLVLSLNGNRSIIARDRDVIALRPGETLEIEHIQSNYRRGLSADVQGFGGDNDVRRVLKIDAPTSIIVKKDSFKCGEVKIELEAAGGGSPEGDLALHVRRNRQPLVLKPNDVLDLIEGDSIVLDGLAGWSDDAIPAKVNLVGFVPPDQRRDNRGHDLAYPVNTATDLMPNWSVGRKGETYRITASRNSEEFGNWFLRVVRSEVRYLLVEINGTRTWYRPGESVTLQAEDTFEIVDVEAWPADSAHMTVNFRGFPNAEGSDDRGRLIRMSDLLPRFALDAIGKQYKIVMSRYDHPIAEVFVTYP